MKKVLCVDDEPGILRSLRVLLGQKGYEVTGISDPTLVPEYLQANDVDLIVLDVQMPEKSGLEVFDELKASCATFPILFLTGWPAAFHLDQPEKIERWQTGFADGRTDILYKPFVTEDLYDKVESLVTGADSMVQ